MTISFEPGDGSFEIHLDATERLPRVWNRPGVTVLRSLPSCFSYVKHEYDVLPDDSVVLI
jgi:hypothetical protein